MESILDDELPEYLVCPITCDIMNDPVALGTDAGHSYEREAIERHLSTSPYTDPMTGIFHAQPLRYFPNRALKDAVEAWRRKNHTAVAPVQEKREGKLASMQPKLDKAERLQLARNLCTYSNNWDKENNECRTRCSISTLVDMLERDEEQQLAASALCSLGRDQKNKVAIARAGAIPALFRMLAKSDLTAKDTAAAALCNLANYPGNKLAIARAGVIPLLVDLLKVTKNARNAVAALRALAANNSENKIAIAKAGAIPHLVRYLKVGSDGTKEWAALAVATMATNNVDNREALKRAGALHHLKILCRKRRSDGTTTCKTLKQNAADALSLLRAK